ncbi:spindle pole body component [Trifolium repens]|nr:spindle pole body component [Trifolium repens]
MAVQGSDKLKFCGGSGGGGGGGDGRLTIRQHTSSSSAKSTLHLGVCKSNSYDDRDYDDDVTLADLESKPNKFDGQLKRPRLIELFDEEAELVASDTGNQSSPTSDQDDEFESVDSDDVVNLEGVSDPSKVVLEIIQHPTIEKCKMGDNDVIIGDNHIRLLEQLMRISPHIEPDVREEALKLALDLKANAEENNENSVDVLGFLLLLSIYGLAPAFDEDDVLKFFGLVSQHNIAIELFRAMGFADKISDFVDGLIERQQYVEAVRFSCAFNISSDNNQPVDLLREHVHNTKLISESSCNKSNSIEIKDKARDQEIASLETVQQCLSDNNLQFEDLRNEINDRILELRTERFICVYGNLAYKKGFFFLLKSRTKPFYILWIYLTRLKVE